MSRLLEATSKSFWTVEMSKSVFITRPRFLEKHDLKKSGIISLRCFWPLIGKDFAGDWDARNSSGSSFTLRGVSMALSPKDILSALQWDFLSFFPESFPLSYDCRYFA